MKEKIVSFAKINPWCFVFTLCLVFGNIGDAINSINRHHASALVLLPVAIFVGVFLYFIDELTDWVNVHPEIYIFVLLLLNAKSLL